MEQKRSEFLTQVISVYMKFGIKSVTMDELARQLGMSKKTIYTFAKDKNDLVEQCMSLAHQGEEHIIEQVCANYDNAIDELLAIGETVSERLRSIHPSIFFDLQRYHPKAYAMFNKHKETVVKGCILNNLENGKKQGLYRDNLNVEIIAKMYLAFIDVLFGGEVFPFNDYQYNDVYSEYFRYHIRGISSLKGRDYLLKIIKEKNLKS
jgi:AcrR family transcriptional regulator